jgi:chromosome segregation ATPase
MNTTNYESTEARTENKSTKNIIIGVLAAAVIGLGAYTIADKNKTGAQLQEQETQIAKVSGEKSEIQNNFDASLARLDSMSTVATGLETKLTDKDKEIAKVKAEIRSILNNKNATAAQLTKARKLIDELNGKITTMEEDIARLNDENKVLNEDKIVLTQDRDRLTQDLTLQILLNRNWKEK